MVRGPKASMPPRTALILPAVAGWERLRAEAERSKFSVVQHVDLELQFRAGRAGSGDVPAREGRREVAAGVVVEETRKLPPSEQRLDDRARARQETTSSP
jgi:hypothetical protein